MAWGANSPEWFGSRYFQRRLCAHVAHVAKFALGFNAEDVFLSERSFSDLTWEPRVTWAENFDLGHWGPSCIHDYLGPHQSRRGHSGSGHLVSIYSWRSPFETQEIHNCSRVNPSQFFQIADSGEGISVGGFGKIGLPEYLQRALQSMWVMWGCLIHKFEPFLTPLLFLAPLFWWGQSGCGGLTPKAKC